MPAEAMHKPFQIAIHINKFQFVLASANWKTGIKKANLCDQGLVCLVFTEVNFQVSAKNKITYMHAQS